MTKKSMLLLLLPLLAGGCATTLTNLTPQRQVRSTNNFYTVEVALSSKQQTLVWASIKPHVIAGGDFIPMHPTPLMTNRWEGLLPVPAGTSRVNYRYKLDFQYNAVGAPRDDSIVSKEYTLAIVEPHPADLTQ